MWSIMKNREENDLTNHIGVIFVEYNTKLLRLIE